MEVEEEGRGGEGGGGREGKEGGSLGGRKGVWEGGREDGGGGSLEEVGAWRTYGLEWKSYFRQFFGSKKYTLAHCVMSRPHVRMEEGGGREGGGDERRGGKDRKGRGCGGEVRW